MRVICLLAIAAALLSAGSAIGHHSPAAFDVGSFVNIRGEVTRFDWKNPHVYILIEEIDDSGQPVEWQVEADPTPLMRRSGWTSSTLRPGEIVSVQLNPDRNSERKHGRLVSLTKADGVTLGLRSGEPATKTAANDISGIWDVLGNFSQASVNQIYDSDRAYTRAGINARAEYTNAAFPPAVCLPFPTPALMVLPYLNEIELLEDRVLIRSEFYSADRTVYMDGRGHPEKGVRTIQGHSIGHWDGGTLLVDTRLFADYRLANGPGVPSGPQKHTIERFELSTDKTQLNVEIFVEDPEFVVEAFTVSAIWDFAPEREMERFGCDPENARFFDLR